MASKQRLYHRLSAIFFVVFLAGSLLFIVTPLTSLWSAPFVLIGAVGLVLEHRFKRRAKETC